VALVDRAGHAFAVRVADVVVAVVELAGQVCAGSAGLPVADRAVIDDDDALLLAR
jgi:hypothetical protein